MPGGGSRPKDLEGKIFGLLLVIEQVASTEGDTHARWRCQCECGALAVVRSTTLLSGRQVSCGCQRANEDVRRAARYAISEDRRREIAALAAAVRWT